MRSSSRPRSCLASSTSHRLGIVGQRWRIISASRWATDVKVYFCDPQQPWQRGSNESTNGLLRQYFPKGIDLSDIPQGKLNAIARRLNERPRQTLDFETPAEPLANVLRRSIEFATRSGFLAFPIAAAGAAKTGRRTATFA